MCPRGFAVCGGTKGNVHNQLTDGRKNVIACHFWCGSEFKDIKYELIATLADKVRICTRYTLSEWSCFLCERLISFHMLHFTFVFVFVLHLPITSVQS